MIQKQLQLIFIVVLFLCSCSDNNSSPHKHHDLSTINKVFDSINYSYREKHFGVSLVNQPLRGASFIDSTGEIKQFRSLRVQIVNDTVIPLAIKLYFSNKFNNLFHLTNKKFKAFLLPDSVSNFGRAQNKFLNEEIEKPSALNKIIQPGEIFIVTIGMLFSNTANTSNEIILSELFFEGEKPNLNLPDTVIISINNKYTKGLDIILGVTLSSHSNYYSTIPCGQLSLSK
jgi:hypothetical protein